MQELVEFNPILKNSPKEAIKYFQDNNIEIPNIPAFQSYLNTEIEVPSYSMVEKDSTEIPLKNEVSYDYQYKPKDNSKQPIIKPKDSNSIINEIKGLSIDNNDKEYLVKLAKKESSYNPHVTNQFGYYGLYQFGDLAFKDTGFTKTQFETDTLAQHQGALKLAQINEKRLRPIINAHVGKTFKGINITRNGIRAAAHLLGATTVKDWFTGSTKSKYARNGFVDGNGTSIEEYFKMYE